MNKYIIFLWEIIVFYNCFAIDLFANNLESKDSTYKKNWQFEKLNFPEYLKKKHDVVKVAVIDDGCRFTHKSIMDFLYTNPNEIPYNFRDDDNNGYIDDICGWDASDNDNKPYVPETKEESFLHGTYITGIIISVFKQYFGDDASKYLKIIPVKVVSDKSDRLFILDGYKGIHYADIIGADIICCAWNGGSTKYEEIETITKAINNGAIIIAAAGNFFSEKDLPPASINGVISVAAIDTNLRKIKKSNYGMNVDFSAPGEEIYGPHPIADNAFIYESGTSPASAIITGCIAILKSINPKTSSSEIIEALKNTANPLDSINNKYSGKLGAGMPNMSKAIDYLTKPNYKYSNFNNRIPEGKIFYKKNLSPKILEIKPYGDYKGINLIPDSYDNNAKINVYSKDSLLYNGLIKDMKLGLFLRDNYAKIEVNQRTKQFSLDYYVETIDSTTLYCNDIVYINKDSGIVTDGSGKFNYANKCDCKWLITVPENKKIKIEFTKMDTEANVDFVWIYEGNSTTEEELDAKFSGQNMPPVIKSLTNQVLLWFVTDDKTTGDGWEMKYKAVE